MVDEKLKELSSMVRVLRAKNDMSQNELADKAGVSVYTITFLENCHKVPRANTLVKIAKALNVDAQDLLKYIL